MKTVFLRSNPVVLAVVALLLLPPTVAAADQAVLVEGARVFSEIAGVGCKTCHGEYAEGDLGVGPFIRGATEGSIRASIDATTEMIVVKNAITEDEISAISAYLAHLGTMQVARTLAKRGRFIPAGISVRPATSVQVVIQNSGLQPYTFKSDNMGIDEVTIPARSSAAIEWQTPESEGEYSLYCINCKLKNQFYTVHVDASAQEFRGVTSAAKVVAQDAM